MRFPNLANTLLASTLLIYGVSAIPSPSPPTTPTSSNSDSKSAICPHLPNPLPSATSLPIITALPNPFTFFNGQPLRSQADWSCRKEELKILVQEYLYGYYPDHSLEHVSSHRFSNDTILIEIRKGSKVANFSATLTFPNSTTSTTTTTTKERKRDPIPVVINTGGLDNDVFLESGVALATFDVTTVAVDAPVQQGAFWDLYAGEDIGKNQQPFLHYFFFGISFPFFVFVFLFCFVFLGCLVLTLIKWWVGVLTAWAWGFHRILDAIIQVVPEIDAKRVGVTGCSRWGKAALAAGIFDERVRLVFLLNAQSFPRLAHLYLSGCTYFGHVEWD